MKLMYKLLQLTVQRHGLTGDEIYFKESDGRLMLTDYLGEETYTSWKTPEDMVKYFRDVADKLEKEVKKL